MKALGTKISELRKAGSMTQDELAGKMGVSPQAISKREDDLSMSDLPVLIELLDFFHISLDDFLEGKAQTVEPLPEDERKDIEQTFLRVHVNSENGDRVRVNLPLVLVKMTRDMGLDISQMIDNPMMQEIDLGMIMQLIEGGAIGKPVEVNSTNGDHVEMIVEQHEDTGSCAVLPSKSSYSRQHALQCIHLYSDQEDNTGKYGDSIDNG